MKAYWSQLMFTGKAQKPKKVAGDDAVKKAVAAGAKCTRPATDEFYGDRSGTLGEVSSMSRTICWASNTV